MLNRKDFCRRYKLSKDKLGFLYAKKLIPEPIKLGNEYYWRETDIRRFDAYLRKRARCRDKGIDPDSAAGPGVPCYSSGIQSADIRSMIARDQERERREKSKTLQAATAPIEPQQVPTMPEPTSKPNKVEG